MKNENVKPDVRSFALALETVARSQPIDVKMPRSIAKQMQDRVNLGKQTVVNRNTTLIYRLHLFSTEYPSQRLISALQFYLR